MYSLSISINAPRLDCDPLSFCGLARLQCLEQAKAGCALPEGLLCTQQP